MKQKESEVFMFANRIIVKLSLSLDRINVRVMQRIIHTTKIKLGRHNSSIKDNWDFEIACHPISIVTRSRERN